MKRFDFKLNENKEGVYFEIKRGPYMTFNAIWGTLDLMKNLVVIMLEFIGISMKSLDKGISQKE